MTKEEAKEIIEDLKYSLDISLIGISEINEIDNAIDMAIEALNKEIKQEEINKMITKAMVDNAYEKEN